MSGGDGDFERSVFINCPFDNRYRRLLRPLLYSIVHLGFLPRLALESSDAGELRLQKICSLIQAAKYSIHDLSRLQSVEKGEFYRLNMPFELGIDYGCRRFSENHLRDKRCLILEKERFAYMRALSDLAGVDIKDHDEDPEKLVLQVRNWFVETVGLRRAPSANVIWYSFTDFTLDFHDRRKAEGFSDRDLAWMPVPELIDFMREWVQANVGQPSL